MMNVKEKMMNQRYHLQVARKWIQVIDTKLFTAISPNGVCVVHVGCGDNLAKRAANLKQLVDEYDIAPQNIKYLQGI